MHKLAAQWDWEHGKSIKHHVVHNGKLVTPKDRPCDWCGEPVEFGYIHEKCAREESKLYCDILDGSLS